MTDAPPICCYHTWISADGPAWHVHACAGLPSRHEAPCRCACGGLDYCTRWGATMPPSHKTAPPPPMETTLNDM